ncbi:Hypothetical predicted protein [Olea europaea subsp. europaea]|uniref:MOM1 alpha-helical domain-containing protein n=2 Tax=Olea europaea subsp. europaea TaxID=158383 RepID=A0A8S0S7N7_OLEEU|nr:Hypothetical predicted protein [Olea europaea subsp. europaea]
MEDEDVVLKIINLPLLGEGKFQLKDGEEAHVFWRKLLEGRNPQWKYSCGSTPRNRKRVQFFDESSGNPDTGSDEVRKKHRKAVNENVDPASIQVEPKGHQLTQAAGCKGGSSTAVSTTQSQSVDESTSHQTDNVNPESNSNFIFGQSSFDPGVHVDKSQEIVTSSNEQKSLHIIIKGEMARLCQILKVSEDVMHMVERFLEYVIKNHHVSNESPTIIQAFQISLCWIAASILKQKINKKDSLMTAKQFLNYGCTEEQANHVYSKMRLLKKMFLQCSLNTKKSIKDCLLSTEDFSIESCKTDAGIPQFSVVSLLSVKSDIERSANKEHSSGLIVSEHKKPLKNKVAECETEYMLKKIRRKCDKRLKILLRKQQEEVQKFHRIWEEKKERLEKEHKLESACIRFIHGGSVTIDKLKLLDSDFAKKMEEYKCLKDMHVKDLEANQLVARNDERRKAARWLAKAKACHSELKAVDDPVGCSETRAHITLRDPENAVPMSEQHIEDTNPTKAVHLAQENDVAPSNTCVIAQAEAVGCTVPTETANHLVNITSEREVGSSSFESTSIAELPSELTHSSNTTREMASVDLPGCGELVSNEIQMVQASEGIPTGVPDTIPEDAGHVHSVEQSDFSNKKCDIGDRIDTSLSDDVNQIDGDESIDGCPSSLEQSLLPPAETFAPSDHCGSLPPSQVLLESSVYGEFQLGDAPVPENRSTLQVEVAISKHIDSETCALSKDLLSENLSTLQVGVATSERINSEPPAQSNHAPAIENREQLQPVSIDVSLSCDRTPASEVEHENYDRERILIPETSPQSSGEPEALSHQVACQRGQELEQHHPVALVDSTLDRYHLDLGLVSQVNHVPNGEFFASQSFLSAPQAVVNTAELPSQVIWQTEVDLSHARGSGNLTSQPPYQVPSWHPAPSLHAEPLLNELLRISKEREKTVKVYEDLKLLLKSECEKAIEEVIAQIRNKFEAKLHDAEIAFHLKKNELDKNHNNVLMNRILAEAFRSKCLDLKPSSPSRLQQAMSSSFMQQLPMPRPVRHPVSSVCPQTTVPTVQASQQLPLPLSTVPAPIFVSSSSCQPWTMASTGQATHQPLLPHSTGPASGFVSSSGCQPVASQHNPTPAVQTVHRASALCSGAPTRPPHISAITPSTGNLRIGEVRSPAPHLQPFQPSTSASAASLPSHGMPSQQATATRPATSPSFSQHTPQRTPHSQVPSLPQQLPLVPTNSVSHNRPQPESRPSAPHNSSQSAFQLLVDMDHQSPVHGRTTVASLRDVVTNFGSLELSDLETLGNVQGSLTSSVPATDVVYLSDDN